MQKKIICLLGAFCCLFSVFGQWTIEECHRKARLNYPLIRQYGLIEQSEEYNLSNAGKGYLPKFSLSAKASYQSEVTELPIKLPNVNLEGPGKDQYQLVAEMNQSIWDGGIIRSQRKITWASGDVERQKLDVDMYGLNERVNQLFFGVLLLNEQEKQNILLQEELERNYRQISAYIESGIANQADLDAVKVNQLNARQRQVELETTVRAYCEMLSAMVGEEVSSGTLLVRPEDEMMAENKINRPELQLLNAQDRLLETQKKMLLSKNMPTFGLFLQGGYGNPGLNMLKNEFSPYYIGGVRLSWNFSGFYTKKNERRLLETSQENLAVQRETFLYNTQLQMTKENHEISKIRKLMQDDDEIIRLRANIKVSAEYKVENGTMSVLDLLREINAEDQAKQNKALHEIQLLMSIYNLKNITNN